MSKRALTDCPDRNERAQNRNENVKDNEISTLQQTNKYLTECIELVRKELALLKQKHKHDSKSWREVDQKNREVISVLKAAIQDHNMTQSSSGESMESILTTCKDELKLLRDKCRTSGTDDGLHQNSYNFVKMGAYTHPNFLNSMMDAVPTVSSMLTPLFAPAFVDSSSTKSDARRTKLHSHALAMALAWLCEVHVESFTWEYTSSVLLTFKTLTNSEMIMDIAGFVLPGGVNNKTFYNRVKHNVNVLKGNDKGVFAQSDVTISHDNCPAKQNLRYRAKTSRGGKEEPKDHNKVIEGTVRCALHKTSKLQFDVQLSPKNDKNSEDAPLDLHLLRKQIIDKDKTSEEDALHDEKYGYLQKILEEKPLFGEGLYVDNLEDTSDNVLVFRNRMLKYCAYCDAAWSLDKRVCSLCLHSLPTKKTYLANLDGVTEECSSMYDKSKVEIPRNTDVIMHKSNKGSDSKGEDKFVVGSSSSSESGYNLVNPDFGVNRHPSKQDYNFECIWPMPETPSSFDAIQRILDRGGKDARVVGFVEPEEARREWFEVSADLGAMTPCLKLLDENRKTSKYGNIRFKFPSGHENMSMTKVVLKLCREYGYGKMAAAYGFWNDRQQTILFAGFDQHICLEWILKVTPCVYTGGDSMNIHPIHSIHSIYPIYLIPLYST